MTTMRSICLNDDENLELKRVTEFTMKLIWGNWISLQPGIQASQNSKF